MHSWGYNAFNYAHPTNGNLIHNFIDRKPGRYSAFVSSCSYFRPFSVKCKATTIRAAFQTHLLRYLVRQIRIPTSARFGRANCEYELTGTSFCNVAGICRGKSARSGTKWRQENNPRFIMVLASVRRLIKSRACDTTEFLFEFSLPCVLRISMSYSVFLRLDIWTISRGYHYILCTQLHALCGVTSYRLG